MTVTTILHVLDHSLPLQSGYVFRTLALLGEQRRLGWDTVQVTSSKHGAASALEEDVDGWRFFRTPASHALLRRFPAGDQAAAVLETQHRLEQVIEATAPDVVHVHSPCLNGIAAIRALRRRRLPLVYEMRASWEDAAVDHGTTQEGSLRYRASRELETWVLRRADAITTICEGLRQDILLREIPADRVTVIPNGVDIDQFPLIEAQDAALRSTLGLDGAFVLGFLGSFYAYEGLDLLIDALPLILEVEPRARILLVGGGPEERRLASLVKQRGLGGKVVMVGRVHQSDVRRYYSLVDLLVFPRRSTRLTEKVTPLKPLEAMAQGRLLIASDVGGHRELIDHGRTGWLFSPDSAAALTGAVRTVLEAGDRWVGIRRHARQFVESERTWRASAARYPAVYEQARRGKGQP